MAAVRQRGVLYMVGSAAGFSVMSVLVQVASVRRGLPTGEIVLARGVATLAISLVMVWRAGVAASGHQRGKLALRGVLGFGGLAGYYLALAHLPLADASTLQNVVPLLTAVLAWRWLGEPIAPSTRIALGCGFVGVMLVAHPAVGAPLDPIGVVAALAGAACSATAYVTVRQLSRTEHPLVIVTYFPLVAVPLAIPWAAMDWVTPAPADWLLLAAIGAATQVGQVFLTLGLAAEQAGRATTVGYVQICFAMVWQLVVFGTTPTATTLAGAALIVAGTLVVSGVPARGAARRSRGAAPPADDAPPRR
jgi:drug/metabolite transporter (DMT)-like permease